MGDAMTTLARPEESGFYLVWCEGGGNPTRTHASRQEAEDEAERLAQDNRGVTFTVLRAVSRFRIPAPAVERTPLSDPDEDMPF